MLVKPTTLAKIATQYAVSEEKSCVLATFDVKRIMATAQLEKYAIIMGVNFRILRSKTDLRQLLGDFIQHNLIFVDTAGTSPKDFSYISEMEEFINFIHVPREVHLCLNAALRKKEMQKIVSNFKNTAYDRAIITKSDESDSMGPVLSTLYQNRVDISYITNGQDVPSDIALANEDKVSELLLKEWSVSQ